MAYFTDTDNTNAVMQGNDGSSVPGPLKKAIKSKKPSWLDENLSPEDVKNLALGPDTIDLRKPSFSPIKPPRQAWDEKGPMDTDRVGGGNDGSGNGSGTTPQNSIHPSKPVIQTSEAPKVLGANPDVSSAASPSTQTNVDEIGGEMGKGKLPTLTPQGSSNRFLRFFQKSRGEVGDQPKPGELYNTPEEQAKNIARGRNIAEGIRDLGLGLAAGGGSTVQQAEAMKTLAEEPKLAVERANIQNEMQHRRALEDEANRRIATGQQRADISQEQLDINKKKEATGESALNLKGASTGYVKQADGSWRPMTADEYAKDPRLANDPAMRKAALDLKQAEIELTNLRKSQYDVNSPYFQQKERDIQSRMALTREGINARLQGMEMIAGPRWAQAELGYGKEAEQIWQLPQDSGKQLQNMRQSFADMRKTGSQQAALNILANHIQMTTSKNQRITQALFEEAQQSDPLLRRIRARFDENGYLTGVVLTPEQAAQMVTLGEEKYRLNVQDARRRAEYFSTLTGQQIGEPALPIDPDTPIGGGKTPTKGNVQKLNMGGGRINVPTPISNAANSTKPKPKW